MVEKKPMKPLWPPRHPWTPWPGDGPRPEHEFTGTVPHIQPDNPPPPFVPPTDLVPSPHAEQPGD